MPGVPQTVQGQDLPDEALRLLPQEDVRDDRPHRGELQRDYDQGPRVKGIINIKMQSDYKKSHHEIAFKNQRNGIYNIYFCAIHICTL